MESATASGASRPLLIRLRALPATTWAKLGLGGLCVVALVGFLAFPTYPIYDSEYYLLWGREILHLHTPSFAAYDAPTEHPLAVVYGTVLAIFGNAALRLIVLSAIASFVILAAGSTASRASRSHRPSVRSPCSCCARVSTSSSLRSAATSTSPSSPRSSGLPRSRSSARAAARRCSCCSAWPS